MSVSVSKLHVTDNSGDLRYPFIFQNLPELNGQQDLVTFKLKSVEKDSPQFVDCETMIDIGFSGLVFYWKPQTMVNLLEFIVSQKSDDNQQANP